MRTRTLRFSAALLGLSAVLPAASFAGVSAEQAARLGQDLTPMGAEKAASADGAIPAWDGGVTKAPDGYKVGDHHPDPFSGDAVKFTISKANAAEHSAKLTAGHLALLNAYDSYKMPVYATHRSAAFPQRIYDGVKANATTAQLAAEGNGVLNAITSIPFPIPATGQEAIWNHLLRYRGVSARRTVNQAAPTRGGDYVLVRFEEEFLFPYMQEGMTPDRLENIGFYFKQTVVAPAKLAGSILLVHETIDQVKEPRGAWIYNTGQRRVRRAPNVAYDNPGTASDDMRTSDQLDMFNGAIDRYNWELVGKKELYVPYNSYRLHSDHVKYKDILTPLHINQDLTRYELHRVWVVDAKVKPGQDHLYARRTFYIDEDSWQILAVDQYDKRGEIWRVSEAHCIQYYDEGTFWSTVEVHTDLQRGRYLAFGLDNEDKMYQFNLPVTKQDFTPASLRQEGTR